MYVQAEIVANLDIFGDHDWEKKFAICITVSRLQQSKAVPKHDHAFRFQLLTLITGYF